MSNCVKIYNDSIIPWAHIPEPQMLMAHIHAAARDPNARSPFSCNYSNHHFHWFLTPSNVFMEDEGICISWGGGNSDHTWRDLKGTLQCLDQYLVPNSVIRFEMADEFDGFKDKFTATLNCSNPFEV